MVRVRETGYGFKPNSIFGSRTTLGWQFKVGRTWYVVARCKCGRVQVVESFSLVKGYAGSCSCSRKRSLSLLPRIQEYGCGIKPGDKIGRRTVLGWQFSRGGADRGRTVWAVVTECDCGTIGVADVRDMQRRGADSCGCLIADVHRVHGFRGRHDCDPLYGVWVNMRERCRRPSHISWHRYGGRGISVCQDWNGSGCFPAFRDWSIKNGWKPGLQLDRIDNDGNYEPGNCRWVTTTIQARNKSTNRMLAAFGETKCVTAWLEDSRCTAADSSTILTRLKRGLSNEEAISTPVASRNRGKRTRSQSS